MNCLQKLHKALKLSNNLYGKLVSLLKSTIIFDESFRAILYY